MARQVVDIKGLAASDQFPWSMDQIRDLMKRADYPLPHKRVGKKYYFDLERVWKWFDSLPGASVPGERVAMISKLGPMGRHISSGLAAGQPHCRVAYPARAGCWSSKPVFYTPGNNMKGFLCLPACGFR